MDKPTWILVADRQRARIFATDSRNAPWQELTDLVHTEARLPERELQQDRPGRTFDSHGPGRHALETKRSPREQEALYFVGQIVEHLRKAHSNNEFSRLVVCAEPRLLGLLREAMPAPVAAAIVEEVHKDLTQLKHADEIRAHLPETLQPLTPR